LLESKLKRAHPARRQALDDQLEITPRGVDRHVRLSDNLEAFLQSERNSARISLKERGADLPPVVFQREVGMTRSRLVEVTDLANDPNSTDLLLKETFKPSN
jgi:hypothetical protein